jgi:hypothetical protein
MSKKIEEKMNKSQVPTAVVSIYLVLRSMSISAYRYEERRYVYKKKNIGSSGHEPSPKFPE